MAVTFNSYINNNYAVYQNLMSMDALWLLETTSAVRTYVRPCKGENLIAKRSSYVHLTL